MFSDRPKTIYRKNYTPPGFLISDAVLDVDLAEDAVLVRSHLVLGRNPASSGREETLRLDGEDLELLEIRQNGQVLARDAYTADANGLTLHSVPEQFELETLVRIRPQENTRLEGLYRSGSLFCTQCEAEGFRRIAYYLDRPDVMARFTTRISADKTRYPVLLSNGNPVLREDLPKGRHRVVWEDPFPKPSYLFALVAGDLFRVEDRYTTRSARRVILQFYVESENRDKCGHAMLSLKRAMRWDEEKYGREYDLDVYMIVAVNHFNMGAMENKGLNIFNSKFVLARPDTATDRDFQGIEGVIAHEYFHNWTGNRITCRDWFQLSLKEGFTVYRDQEFSADMGSRGVTRIEDVRLLRAHQFAEDASPMAHPVRPDSYIEINNFYTSTVYEKGAEVVRMLSNLLGPDLFRAGTDLYFARHDGQAVTTDDFVRCMEEVSTRSLAQFQRWYAQAGTPELAVESEYDPAAKVYTLHVAQTCPDTPGQKDKLPFHIPLAVGLLDSHGRDIPLQLEGEAVAREGTRMLEVRDRRQSFRFVNVAQSPRPSLARGFSAPVKILHDRSDEDLMFLMARDSDPFNRWDAAQTLAQRLLLALVIASQRGLAVTIPAGFTQAFRTALLDPQADKGLLAEVLSLPSETYLGDQMEVVDVDAIHSVREALRGQLALALREPLLRVYEALRETDDYDILPTSIGRRALKNLCLAYLARLPDAEARELCMRQFRTGHNMTDVVAALAALSHCVCPEREQALQEFGRRWEGDPLVMDKWFTIQATSQLPDTLDRVQTLLGHPAFSLRNPNKVRSLVGAFCAGNPVRFHAADGAGYRFLVDRVLELDRLNPQVAARLLRGMTRWRRFDQQRQHLMQSELQRVVDTAGLSSDVFEIATKSLEQT